LRSLIYVLLSPRIEEQKLGERGREEGERKTASRGDEGGKEHTTRTGATVFMDMVVNIFVLSFCYVLYMRKERTLSRSKKPDEFSPSTPNTRICVSSQFFPSEGFSFSRSELGLKAPRRRPQHNSEIQNSKKKRTALFSRRCCPSVG
jgi:hypothetical protein